MVVSQLLFRGERGRASRAMHLREGLAIVSELSMRSSDDHLGVRLELFGNQEPAEVCAYALLEVAANRASSIHGVISVFQDNVDSIVVEHQLDILLLEAISKGL
jgi:hypothetical protein